MYTSIRAHFDGEVIVPEEPVHLPVGQSLRLTVELTGTKSGKYSDLLDLATDLPDAPADLSEFHDHYLYGAPK